MFATDSFMNAEVTYREGRIRREWSGRRSNVWNLRKKDADAR
jgi:hypothetical protein